MHRTALLLCLALPLAAPAQEDADFQFLQSLTQTRYWDLGRPTSIRVTPDGSAVLFLRALPRNPELRLFAFDVKTGRVREVITPEQVLGGASEQLSPAEAARRERMRVTSRGFTSYELSDDGRSVLVTLSGRAYLVPVAGGEARQVAGPGPGGEPVFDPRLSPDGKSVAFVRSGELWVAPVDGSGEVQITSGASALVTPKRVTAFCLPGRGYGEAVTGFSGWAGSPIQSFSTPVESACSHTSQRESPDHHQPVYLRSSSWATNSACAWVTSGVAPSVICSSGPPSTFATHSSPPRTNPTLLPSGERRGSNTGSPLGPGPATWRAAPPATGTR